MAYLSLISLFVLWELSVHFFEIAVYVLPAPSAIVSHILLNKSLLFKHLFVTLFESLAGLALAMVVAIFLGVLMRFSKRFHALILPLVLISQMIPLIAISPLIISWLGFGIFAKIIIVALVIFFPMLQSFIDGMQQVNPEYEILLRNLNASSWLLFWKLYFPFALYRLFSGTKVAITYCVSAAMISEWLGGQSGLGVYIQRSMSSFKMEGVFAGIFLIVVSTLILYGLFNFLERKLPPQYC